MAIKPNASAAWLDRARVRARRRELRPSSHGIAEGISTPLLSLPPDGRAEQSKAAVAESLNFFNPCDPAIL